MEIIAIILEQVLQELIKQGVNYIIRKTVDALGNTVTEILYKYDSDGDGIEDAEQVIYTLDTCIPDMSEGYAIVNKGDEIGIGLPQYELVDAVDMVDRLVDTVTGNNNGYLIGDNVYVPLPFDYTGDGQLDWGRVVDEDGNGIPDASDNAPFYPVGSDGYNSFINRYKDNSGVDIVLVSPEGEIAVYDRNGNIKEEDVDTAYATWVSKNGIMNKEIDNYSVSEGLLLCLLLISGVFFLRSLFKRKDVFK